MVVIEWDPALHSSGYDCIKLADSGGDASNNAAAIAVIDYRYKGTSVPVAITD